MNNLLFGFLKKLSFMSILCVVITGCSSILPSATPASTVYDIGLPKSLSVVPEDARQNFSSRDVIVIPDALVDGAENGLGIVYRYTNVLNFEPRHYTNARWAQHPAELLRFRMLQHLGIRYPVVLNPDFVSANSWVLRLTLEEFAHHVSSDINSSGVVQIRVTLGQGNRFVAQKTFRAEVDATTVNVQGGVEAIARATDNVLNQIAEWSHGYIQAQYISVGHD